MLYKCPIKSLRHLRRSRRGLAPLELVLCLPVLLFVLALMVDAGSKSSWKLRGLVTARDAAWRSRFGRGGNLPNPANWPPPATMSASAVGPIPSLTSGELDQPVVRGPELGTILVNRDLLDPTRGGWIGRSQLVWTPPLLPKLGAATLDQSHPLQDGKWQHTQMGIPSTYWRRIPYLYTLPQAPAGLETAYQVAVTALQTAPFRSALVVLDHDEELRAFYGSYRNFHPQVSFCDYDRQRVAANQQQGLIRRIQGDLVMPRPRRGVPGTMAQAFINMYRQQQNEAAAELLEGYLQMLPN